MSELPELGKGYKRGDEVIILGRNGILSEDDANEIIRRCNCHDGLVAALNELVDIVDNSPKDIDSFTTQPAKAALAKAKEPKTKKHGGCYMDTES